MKLKKGYRPWVARKAPLFTHSLNETYIKASALLPIVIISALLGAAVGLTSERGLPDFNMSQKKQSSELKNKALASKPVAPSIHTENVVSNKLDVIDTISKQEINTLNVPAIPMDNTQNGKPNPIIVVK